MSSLAVALPAAAAPNPDDIPQVEKSVPASWTPKSVAAGPTNAEKLAVKGRPQVSWPAPGSATVVLPSAARAAGASGAAGGRVKAGALPVTVGGPSAAVSKGLAGAAASAGVPGSVSVSLLDKASLPVSARDGLVFRLGRGDGGVGASRVSVQVDYRGFREAYGADWATRLRLVSLPACALTTPERAECQGKPLPGVNDTAAGNVTADVAVTGSTVSALDRTEAAGGSLVASGGSLVALAAGADGEGGSYSSSPLSASATWQSGSNTGDFSWSYGLRVPPSLGGPSPSISFGYSAGAVDGRTSSANSQPSAIGEGFDYWPGYVERKYKDCQSDGWATYDQCWLSDNATISLNGRASELVKDDTTGVWKFRNDDGSKIERLLGANNGDKNRDGTTEGEYWKVTTTDGTQYFFGLHKLSALPANAGVTGMAGAPDSNSAWTVPVVGNNTGEPCFLTHPSTSVCDQAWRWNLDYVVDVHGNALAYFYNPETNRYHNITVGGPRSYTRGGTVDRIEYGLRAGQTWTATAAPSRVKFTNVERCVPGSSCVKPADYRDVPWDQECLVGACDDYAPTFWSSKRLSKVTTQVIRSGAYDDVDSWTLTHSFPATGDSIGTPVLWLNQIQQTGHLGTTDAVMPPVVFDGMSMINRVTSASGNQVRKWRMNNIKNESGGAVVITYKPLDCTITTLPASPQTNTKRCMPVWWTPPGGSIGLYWFHKYVIAQIDEQDGHGIGTSTTTSYDYVGNAAWRYAEDDGLTIPEQKTWSQWRGYGAVETRSGITAEGRTLEVTRFYRGMDGDRNHPTNATSYRPQSETDITDGLGGVVRDLDELAGQPRERISYDSDLATKTVLNRSISDGWVSAATATSTHPWATVKATRSGMNNTLVRSVIKGGERDNQVVKTFDAQGQVTLMEDQGDKNVPGDEECTRLTYAPNPTKNIQGLTSRVEKYALACANIPVLNPTTGVPVTEIANQDLLISDERTRYDGAATWSPNQVPTQGVVTAVEAIDTWSPTGRTYVTVTKSEVDAYGRGLKTWDEAGKMSETVYTPTTGGPVTAVENYNPLRHKTRTEFEVGNGQPTAQIDANGLRTDIVYDGLGRMKQAWLPGRTKGVDLPSSEYDYTVRKSGTSNQINAVTTRGLRPNGGYNVSVELYDGMMRPVQTQIAAPGGGRTIVNTYYNSRGQVVKQDNPFYNTASPTVDYHPATGATTVTTEYDSAGRRTAEVYRVGGTEQWRTRALYDGDEIVTLPAAGQSPTRVKFDAHGRAKEFYEYSTASHTGPAVKTTYEFNKRSQMTAVKDSNNNTWTYKYDLRGRMYEQTDPDKGTSKLNYNSYSDLISTESNGKKIFYEYDDLGRVIRTRQDANNGVVLTEMNYDTLGAGLLASATRFVNGAAYKTEVLDVDEYFRPLETAVTIPATEGLLAGTYQYKATFNADGSVATTTLPQVGDLGEEILNHGYTPEGMPLTLTSGLGTYVNTAQYSPFGEVTKITLGLNPSRVNLNFVYQEGTRRLDNTSVTRDGLIGNVAKTVYTWDATGNLAKTVDTGSGQTSDTQCFNYDGLRRLKQAWTPTSGDCATAVSNAAMGGPAKYWTNWEYDNYGNRTKQVEHDTPTGDITTDYTYPLPGQGSPHKLLQTKISDNTGIHTFDWEHDASGNVESRPTPSGNQELHWNAEGRLEEVVEDGDTTTYIYDAAGNRLLRRESGTTTLYLPDTELKLTGTAKNATRYYSFAGQVIAIRTGNSLQWACGNNQGTTNLLINAANTTTVQRRRFTPFGEERTTPGTWAGDRGFLGGAKDGTGLTHLGAREYDPDTGRFVSVDPIVDQGDSQQMNGYAYSNNNPTTFSDPSGLKHIPDDPGSPPNDGDGQGTETGDGEITLPPDLQAMLDEARKLQKMSLLDIILQAGGDILMELLGINDIKDCFGKGDIIACVSIVANVIPWAKLFKLPKIVKAIERAWSAVQMFWEKLRWAKRIMAQVDEFTQLARKAAKDAAEAAATRARNAKKAADAAAKEAKEKAQAAARKAAEKLKNKAKDAGETCAKMSFLPGTLVLMSDGSSKPIERVEAGDEVLATDPDTGETAHKPVATKRTSEGDKILVDVKIDIDGDAGGETSTISSTDNHPWWLPDRGEWLSSLELKPGDALLTPDGSRVRIAGVSVYSARAEVHNLTITDIHTYYVVVDDESVLVHNCNSRRLGKNLRGIGEKKPAGVSAQAHHIVPCGSKLALPAQKILAKHGIDINSPVNGVWMSQKGHAATFRRTYYDWVNDEITDADLAGGKQGVLDFLADLKKTLHDVDQVAHTEFY
ncbi:polymorphic toxin-type HINT domain-containing protein [Catellatospora methionotrophica]|uniref:polymorphic toxin-type HINT domain-containing protein n=2 Tax=Catellatospora methionotrophica TaxID=121620 RepID=UPI00140BAFFD|nr:polymorphic toxin-type HINT domain-containing protein [Catellatospora methionotrophica]